MKEIREFLDTLIDGSVPERPVWNKEAMLLRHAPKWNYIDGCMAKAVLDMYLVTKEERYFSFLESFISYYIAEDGTILGYRKEDQNCDNINEGKVLFALYDKTKNEKYKKALDTLYGQLETQPRTKSGNFWHKLIYPNQIWLDGLYMVQPFYLTYDVKYRGSEHYRDVFMQFEKARSLMRDEKTGLLYHGYDETRTCEWSNHVTGLSPNFWTRSLGWYAMALVDTIEVMDEQFFYEYETLRGYLSEVLDALLAYQDKETSLFYQVTTEGGREGNYLESSGSAAIAYALMKGANLKLLPGKYFDYGKNILESMVQYKLKKEDGVFVLKDICLVAGLGGMPGKGSYKERDGSYEYYISEPVVDNDAKGVAPLIFAYTEYLKGEKLK